MKHLIQDLMTKCGVKFGTSGARGLADSMSDEVCYTYTKGFLQYLEAKGELKQEGEAICIAGDLRPSTDRIMNAVAAAALDMGYTVLNGGRIPSPAIALWGFQHHLPSVMVTGSHIPADRNGIKFNKCSGEILKSDEQGITSQVVELPEGRFDEHGLFSDNKRSLGEQDLRPSELYLERFHHSFSKDCLKGKRIGLYQHSAVGRDVLVDLFRGLGAEVTRLGYSSTFIPVDTEAIRDEDVVLARQWSKDHGFDTIISTDGDSDRPLISDENGTWLRGDIAGILAAKFLGADAISTPVSCNTAVDLTQWFSRVDRTQIGSPYVVASMMENAAQGHQRVVGYEANGGFLTQTAIPIADKMLGPLPTRDAVLPALCILLLSIQEGKTISELNNSLPPRFTVSGRLQEFPTEKSMAILSSLSEGSEEEQKKKLEATFINMGAVTSINTTDGLRSHFDNGEIIHLRPSGNAPEFRCYVETSKLKRSEELRDHVLEVLKTLADQS